MEIEIRIGFCDPGGELVSVLDRPEWQRVTFRRRSEIVDEMVCLCERRGLSDVEAWRRCRDGSPHHVIGYWHPVQVGATPGCGRSLCTPSFRERDGNEPGTSEIIRLEPWP